jgi:predicted dehydrogenase
MSKIIRWGILGTGVIARKFAEGLLGLPDAKLAAVGSREQVKADAFAADLIVPKRYGSYERLVEDPEIDAVYIATPHTLHKDNAILCLAAGKPVLVEKPFTINAGQAEAVINIARAKKILTMEAMWTRFLPLMVRLRQMLADGAVGDVRLLSADFGFRAETNLSSRLFNPALGGGALLDVGVYPISLASMIFGPPLQVSGMARIGETGVDEQSAYILGHQRGQLAILYAAVRTNTFQEAEIMGTTGRIKIHTPWWRPTTMTWMKDDLKNDFIEAPITGNGYQYEAAEFMHCLRMHKTECPTMPLNETLSIMKTLDNLRAEWGLRYPVE